MHKEICIKCGIERSVYDLQIEPGYSNPDYRLGDCAYGHTWRNQTMAILMKWFQIVKKKK